MAPELQARIDHHTKELAAALWELDHPAEMSNLETIEVVVRNQVLTHVSPQIALFFVEETTGTTAGRPRTINSIVGTLTLTSKQAKKLGIESHSQISPYLQKCSLLLSANDSYQHVEEEIFTLTGRTISHSTHQRLVHRQEFELPMLQESVEEMSVDGGNVRLRTPLGEPCCYQNYKAISLHNRCVGAFFHENKTLINWVNEQPLSAPFYCLGDGHDGIWNIITEIGNKEERIEILDWYHLMENLYKVGGSNQRLELVKNHLWQGQVDAAILEFKDWSAQVVTNFINYLEKHRPRIVNYSYYQAEGISIGSGSVESLVKQIGARVRLAGAQWKAENVPQVLQHRCAYLNGQLSTHS